jgi:ABC-type branched-subunit amino acid transport system ATPase component
MPTWEANTPDRVHGNPADQRRLLEVENLCTGYGPLQVLWNLSLQVSAGELVALIGPNGAGKTTALRSIAGLIRPTSGTIRLHGKSATGLKANSLARRGVGFISEDSNLFLRMSVHENLMLGAYGERDQRQITSRLESVCELFPSLKARSKQLAGTLSGGERKMLGIGRCFMAGPSLLLVDEPSLGLAPKLVEQVMTALQNLNRQGVAILLAEQHVTRSLHMTSRGYVLEQGRVVLEGASGDLLENDYVKKSYLGLL